MWDVDSELNDECGSCLGDGEFWNCQCGAPNQWECSGPYCYVVCPDCNGTGVTY